MDFSFTDEQKKRRAEFYSVCAKLEKEKPTGADDGESIYNTREAWNFHCYCAKEFAKRGWLSLAWPEKYGGTGNMMDRVLFAEARGYHGIPGVDGFGVQMLAPTLLVCGSEEIKREFLPMIASGEVMFCELWSEPNAGSDLASLTSTAIRHGNEYVINGQKTWTTGGHFADWSFGVFKDDPNGKIHHNMSFILFDMKAPGVTVRPLKYLNDVHIYNEVFFDNVRVPVKIVGQEHEGWAVVNTLAAFERSNIGGIMSMQRQLELVVNFCNKTKQFGEPLSRNPLFRNRLAKIAGQIEAAKALAYRVADLQNRNELTLMDAAAVKIFVSDILENFAAVMTEAFGPYGQVKGSRWAPMGGAWESSYHNHFILSISMGTNEIQKNLIAWRGLGLPRMK